MPEETSHPEENTDLRKDERSHCNAQSESSGSAGSQNQAQEGTFITGDVYTDGGDFVGRDKISITVTREQAYQVSGLPSPYHGLRSFTYHDRFAYAGRTAEVAKTTARITHPATQQILLFVTGASGSGKSSFAQAGLLPALEQHYRDRNKQVRRAVFRPGTCPVAALADAFTQLGLPEQTLDASPEVLPGELAYFLGENTPDGQINLLVIDQFEEFFSQSPPNERDRLFEYLVAMQTCTDIHTHIIVTLRTDYLDELFAYPALWEAAKKGVELRAMTVMELKEAIQGPLEARRSDERYRLKEFEPALLERLAQDAAQQAAYLPLLQVCLGELWNGGELKLERYHGLAAAIQERAEAVCTYRDHDNPRPEQARNPQEQAAILQIFLDLVSVPLDEGDLRGDVRRRRPRRDLVKDDLRARLVADLIDARLLSISSETGVEWLEIIHEALIANWDRLRRAIAERQEHLRRRARFELALSEWLQEERKEDYLLIGVRLAEAGALGEMGDIALGSEEAREYLRRSRTKAEAERQRELERARALAEEQRKRAEAEQRRAEAQAESARRLRRLALYLVGAMILAFITAFFAARFWLQANSAANSSATLAAKNAAIAAENAAIANTAEAASRLAITQQAVAETNAGEAQRQAQIAQLGELSALALTKLERELDLALLLSLEAYKTQDAWQTQNALYRTWAYKPEIAQFLQGHTWWINSIAWSEDGKLASGSSDGRIFIWDAQSGKAVQILEEHAEFIRSVAWSPDGRLASVGEDDRVIMWDLERGEADQVLEGLGSSLNSVAWSADGRLAVSSEEGQLIIWDLEREAAVQILEDQTHPINSIAWSPDGRLASGGNDGLVIVWDLERVGAAQILRGHTDWVFAVAWSRDGRLASGGYDDRVIVWDLERGEAAQVLDGHTNGVKSVAWSADGWLASGSYDGRVIVWNLEIGEVAQNLEGPAGGIYCVAWSNDGRLASGSEEGFVNLYELTGRKVSQTLLGHYYNVSGVAWSTDGRLASGAEDDRVIVWNLERTEADIILEDVGSYVNSVAWSADGRLALGNGDGLVIVRDLLGGQADKILQGHTDWVYSVAWSKDGRLASSANDGRVIVWDVESGEGHVLMEGPEQRVSAVAWSADGRLASGWADGRIIIWDGADDEVVQVLESQGGPILSLAWSGDGRLASGSFDSRVIVWNLSTGEPTRILVGHSEVLNSVAWSADGRLASGSQDGLVIVWDLASGEPALTLGERTDSVSSVAWSLDGQLAAGFASGKVIVWQLNPQVWVEGACQRAGRNLTEEEWKHYLYWKPFYPEYKTCPQWFSPAELEVNR